MCFQKQLAHRYMHAYHYMSLPETTETEDVRNESTIIKQAVISEQLHILSLYELQAD